MENKYRLMVNSPENLEIAKIREASMLQVQKDLDTAKRISKNEGKLEGKLEGKREERIEKCIQLINHRYHKASQDWVQELSETQLNYIYDVIFDEDDYQTFKEKIEKYVS